MNYYISESIPDVLMGDEARIRQILVNLIGNAVKFTAFGSVNLIIEPYNTIEGSKGLQFKVVDTGIGLEPEKLKFLFQPFTQLDAAHNRKYSGIGLGLALCQKLVHMMNGEIWAASSKEGGAEFTFRIPLELPRAANSISENGLEERSPIRGNA